MLNKCNMSGIDDVTYLPSELKVKYKEATLEVYNYMNFIVGEVAKFYTNLVNSSRDAFVSSDSTYALYENMRILCSEGNYRTSCRFKSNDSILKKMETREVDIESIPKKISDVVGLRYIFGHFLGNIELGDLEERAKSWNLNDVCNNLKNCLNDSNNNCNIILYDIVECIINSKEEGVPTLIRKKDYISSRSGEKESGYHSYHLIFRATNGLLVEVQLRTLAQHLWSVCEHRIVYKASNVSDEVRSVFREFGDKLNCNPQK